VKNRPRIAEISSRITGRKLAASAVIAAAIAVAGAFAASASTSARPPTVSQQQQVIQRHLQYRRAHPLTAAEIGAAEKKEQELLKADEEKAAEATPLKSGISQGTLGGPFNACQFRMQSVYFAPPVGSTKTQAVVYSGQSMNLTDCAAGNGAIYEYRYSVDAADMQGVGEYKVPTNSPLKIISVKGNVLYLKTLAGRQFTFDIATGKFSS
jgi:hypothetical protein